MTTDLSPTIPGIDTARRVLHLLRDRAAPEEYRALLKGCRAGDVTQVRALVEDAPHVRDQLEIRPRRTMCRTASRSRSEDRSPAVSYSTAPGRRRRDP